jgi:Fic family protein
LRDDRNRPFRYALPDPAPESLHHIDQGAGGRIEFPEQITNPHTRDRYIISSLVEEAIRSSQLEGALTTREIAKDMIRTQRPPSDTSEQMILNNFRTMQRIRGLKQEGLTPELVFELHRMLTENTLADASAAGRLRRPQDRVRVQDMYNEVYHTPPPAEELEGRLRAMCDFANGRTPDAFMHPVIRAIILHFWLAYDHPFVDGNGRCARALFYWSMLRHNYWLCEYLAISQIIRKAPTRYYRAFLYTETDENDLTYFILYHLEATHFATRTPDTPSSRTEAVTMSCTKRPGPTCSF